MDQFDRLIDEAARGMVQREPSDALTTAVMDRVTGSQSTRAGGGRVIWRGLAAAVTLAGIVLLLILTHVGPTEVALQPPQNGQPEMPRSAADGAPGEQVVAASGERHSPVMPPSRPAPLSEVPLTDVTTEHGV